MISFQDPEHAFDQKVKFTGSRNVDMDPSLGATIKLTVFPICQVFFYVFYTYHLNLEFQKSVSCAMLCHQPAVSPWTGHLPLGVVSLGLVRCSLLFVPGLNFNDSR